MRQRPKHIHAVCHCCTQMAFVTLTDFDGEKQLICRDCARDTADADDIQDFQAIEQIDMRAIGATGSAHAYTS